MTQYNTLNLNFLVHKLYKLKSGIKNGTKVTVKHLFNLIGNSDNFPLKILWTNTQVSRVLVAFANGSSANTKFSNIHV